METHAVISVARVNFRARKFIEMERITVQTINKDLSNSDSQCKYDDIGMWLIFFCGEAISFSSIWRSLGSFFTFKKEHSVLLFSTV